MKIDLYYMSTSAPCRAVMMAAAAIGVELNLKELNLMAGEHMKPEFLKINPQHQIPTIDDNGFILSESRAIIQYLQNAYAKNDSLYPKPAKQRALVDHRLFFDISVLYKNISEAYYPTLFFKVPLDQEKVSKIDTALEVLDGFLDKTKFSAGDSLTLADFCIMATLNTLEALGHKFTKYTKVVSYYHKCKSEIKKYNEINSPGLKILAHIAKEALGKPN